MMSTEIPNWQRDETKLPGTDFTDPAVAAEYDAYHERFRDFERENERILGLLDLRPGQTLLEIGAGTGRCTLAAARRCARVYAVDVSQAMLAVARRRCNEAGVGNVEYHHAGFLTYDHAAGPVDAVVSQAALHHLPDMWKLIGLTRVAGMLKSGGRLCLMDMAFSFEPRACRSVFDGIIREAAEKVGEDLARDLARHIREEYSTFGWIMEGLLRRSGFAIVQADYSQGIFANYLCTKA
jgi:putative AdoMet-dependent methyltransferase